MAHPSRTTRLCTGLLGLALLLGGCAGSADSVTTSSGGSDAPATESNGSGESTTAGSGGAASGQADLGDRAAGDALPAPLRFDATTVDGKSFDVGTLAGKDVVLWFWAPWCVTCARSASDVAKYAAGAPDSVAVVGVAGLSSNVSSMRDFVDRHGVDGFANLADPSGDLFTRFKVAQQHTFAFVDAGTGKVTVKNAYSGGADIDSLAAQAFG